MKKQVNPMLRLGCILLLAGGVVSGVLNLLGPAIVLLGFTSLDNSMYEYAESEMREVTDGSARRGGGPGRDLRRGDPVDHHLCRHAGH